MPHGRRVVLVLECGHLVPSCGRVDEPRMLVGSYTACPDCGTLRRVESVRPHDHAVPV